MALKNLVLMLQKKMDMQDLVNVPAKIDTPAFMPVGTQGTIKGAFLNDVFKTG